jgi:protein SCO1/2
MPLMRSPATHELYRHATDELQCRMSRLAVVIAIIVSISGCSRDRRYELEGQVLAVDANRQEITVKHGDIRGFMPGMTMPFKVSDRRALQKRKAGELIKATLVVSNNSGSLQNIVRTGEAPLPPDAPGIPFAAPLEPGAPVGDATFIDQTGRARRLSDWRGKTLAVTFIYTRCPLPDFCPLMDRNFAVVQRSLAGDQPSAGRIHLVSVSFDPAYDSPDVLAAHAKKVGAQPDAWTWLTGDRDAIDTFAKQFGVSIMRDDRPPREITHNLRTIVIDRSGKVVRIYTGNDWKPEELLATLRAADAS